MGKAKIKYATPAQIDEIAEFAKSGHTEALVSFGRDVVYNYNRDLTRYGLIAFGVGVVAGIISGVVKYKREKRKTELLKKDA